MNAAQERMCTDCGSTSFVEDHSAGDLVCRNCGLVAEAHMVDERSEWRTFSDTDKAGADPNRVGGAFNSLLSDGGLSTSIGQTRVTEKNTLKGRGVQAIYAACIYIACRQEKTPRTFKEICTVVTEANKKDIGRCYKTITQMLKDRDQSKAQAGVAVLPPAHAPPIHPKQYLNRFGTRLGLAFEDIKACIEMSNKACPTEGSTDGQRKPWDGKNPLSIAASIIYIAMHIKAEQKAKAEGVKAEKPSLQNIVVVTGMAEATIRACYRDLYTEIDTLVPQWFLGQLSLQDVLPKPDIKTATGAKAAAAQALAAATAAAAVQAQ